MADVKVCLDLMEVQRWFELVLLGFEREEEENIKQSELHIYFIGFIYLN